MFDSWLNIKSSHKKEPKKLYLFIGKKTVFVRPAGRSFHIFKNIWWNTKYNFLLKKYSYLHKFYRPSFTKTFFRWILQKNSILTGYKWFLLNHQFPQKKFTLNDFFCQPSKILNYLYVCHINSIIYLWEFCIYECSMVMYS